MAIKIKELENLAEQYTNKGYLYKDLKLDIRRNKIIDLDFESSITGPDIQSSYNLAAIQNSLQNLFNTLPGQRFLFPEYGLDFYQFLFSPITELNGQALGDKVLTSIRRYEPRVIPRQVIVDLEPDNNQYTLNIVIEVPSLNLVTNTVFVLNIKNQNFIFVPTSRNT